MDTTPANIMYSDLIYQILPDAKFIEMKRSPLDNISSVLKEPGAKRIREGDSLVYGSR